MKLNIIFLKSKKAFTEKEKKEIENIIKNSATHAAKLLKLGKEHIVNFTVYRFSKKHIWAYTQAEDWIRVAIPQKKFDKNELKAIVCHEMNHVKRGFCGYAEKKISFLEALFAEGLATVFELEQVPERIPESSKYTNKFIKKWLPIFKKENLTTSRFSYDEWFLGQGKKPKRLGYKIGTYLVRQIRKNYPKLTSEKLIKKNAKDLLKLSRIRI